MKNKSILPFILMSAGILLLVLSCKPINLFSPLVDPSKMGNEAKLDAGDNALASGSYDEAIDYYTQVIDSGAAGDELTDAHLGRASAYLRKAAPNLDQVVEEALSGDLDVDNTSDVITQVVGEDGDYTNFFDNSQNSADDYNSAVSSYDSEDIDPGVLLEVYETNMMAATGVGARKIAEKHNDSPWENISNEEYAAITDEGSSHPYNIGTWSKDPDAEDNGLSKYVKNDPGGADNAMMEYLTNAYNALETLKQNPPSGMTASGIEGMQNGINDWVENGLDKPAIP
ncbi:MAG: tetratricopeptide repeat protein [Spirochaetota bacterium]